MGNNPGYIYAPYIIATTTPEVVDSSFSPKRTLKSRYSTVVSGSFYGLFVSKRTNRMSKIEKVFEIKNPTD